MSSSNSDVPDALSTEPDPGIVREPEGVPSAAAEEPQTKGRLQGIAGSKSDDWNLMVGRQVVEAMWIGSNADEKTLNSRIDAVLHAMIALKPRDEIEGMLVAQMVAAHNASMECHRRSVLPNQSVQGRSEALNQANKLSRTYATLLEGLNRHRGEGPQRIIIEKVTVERGAQAIVGVVEGGGWRGRVQRKKIGTKPCATANCRVI